MNVHECGFHFAPVVDEEALKRAREAEDKAEAEAQGGATAGKQSRRNSLKKKKKKPKPPGAGGRVLVRVFFNVDLKIDFLPDMLLNLIIGKFCGAILLLVRKHAHPKKMRGSEYERRIEGNTVVYDEMKRRLAEHLTPEKIRQNAHKYGTARQREVLAALPEVTA